MLTLSFWGADGLMITPETLTSGMVGAKIAFQFSEDWECLNKTAVFMAGNTIRAVSNVEDAAEIPADVLAAPGSRLYVGIYGESEDGTLVIPTICVAGPKIQYGADPLQAPAGEPPVTSYARLLTMIGDLTELKTEAKDSLVAALNEMFTNGSGGNSGSDSTQNANGADVANIQTILGNIMTILKAQTDSENGVERPQGYNKDVSSLFAQNDTLIAALGSNSGGDEETEVEISQSGSVLTLIGVPAITSIVQTGNVLTMT